jgi:hypothetical protein
MGAGEAVQVKGHEPGEGRVPKTRTLSLKRKASDVPLAPHFKRGYVWSDATSPTSPAALSTESAVPFPSVPVHLLNDSNIQSALHIYKDYIKVSTPFNIDRFGSMLSMHPNRPFVDSVIHGLRYGFWPFAEGEWKSYKDDKGKHHYSEPNLLEDMDAIRTFKDREVAAGRWSGPIRQEGKLHPETCVSPVFVNWLQDKPRVITDHKASGINEDIPRDAVSVLYDDMRTFGQCLHNIKQLQPRRSLVLFKSDVAKAFLNLPAHPVWQLRQFVCVDGQYYCVRRLVFGNRASPRIWCAVSGLICWIATKRLDITDLHVYMDDFFGWDFADSLIPFRGALRPQRQVQLLLLWEAISCPFDNEKQLSGPQLKIIGFHLDIDTGTISLNPQSIKSIVSQINHFLNTPGRRVALRHWLQIAGSVNWLLNVLPWGKPSLSEVYRKISGKTHMDSGVFINAEVRDSLTWLKDVIPDAIGVRFTNHGLWTDNEADLVFWTDACLEGLAYVFAGNGFAYQLRPDSGAPHVDILFLELVAILCAVFHAVTLPLPPHRLLIWSDSLDSVQLFQSLHARTSLHNGVLLAVASLLLRSGVDVRVRHIAGHDNLRADLLSRLLFQDFGRQFPSYRVRTFNPPRELLPARWRRSF